MMWNSQYWITTDKCRVPSTSQDYSREKLTCGEDYSRGVEPSVSGPINSCSSLRKLHLWGKLHPWCETFCLWGQLTPVPAIENNTCDKNYSRSVKPSFSGTQLLMFQTCSHLHTSLRIITPIKIGNLNWSAYYINKSARR